jgi:hypothetical protein
LNLKNGKQSRGKFTQFKDLHFPKGCGSLEFELLQKNHVRQHVSPLARTFKTALDSLENEDEIIPSAQTLNEQFAPAPRGFNKNDGFYHPDFSGRWAARSRVTQLS